ncbi:MAG: S1 RNA-binding domain-containing protein [Gammaproteobacteria bacterium]|nr:S1 RNA-binding domain-containing protein [Gammaproteobacteria bacterium]
MTRSSATASPRAAAQLDPERYTDDAFGLPTVRDILAELEKPGRDPRPDFRTAVFREGVNRLEDLEAGMELEGVVTNVTDFGAFVDVGVHQDGLVHVSELADRFVKDPHEVVSAGQVVSDPGAGSRPAPAPGRPVHARARCRARRGACGERAERPGAASRLGLAAAAAARAAASVAAGTGAGVIAVPAGRSRRSPTAPWPTPCARP